MSGCWGPESQILPKETEGPSGATSTLAPLSTPASGKFLNPVPCKLPPTFFPFLASYSMVKRFLWSCHPPGHPRQTPLASFVLFPAWSETPPAPEFLPLPSGGGGWGRWRTLPWVPITKDGRQRWYPRAWLLEQTEEIPPSWRSPLDHPVCHQLCWMTLKPAVYFSVYSKRKPCLSLRNK